MKTETTMLSEPLAKEIENTILTKGKVVSRIIDRNMTVFSLHRCDDERVLNKNKPVYAIFAHRTAFLAIKAPREKVADNCLLLVGWQYKEMVDELAKLTLGYEDLINSKA